MTTTPENRPYKPRKIKLINRDFQIGLMIKFVLANAAILVLFGAVMYLFLHGEIESNLQSAHATYRTLGAMLLPIILTLSLLILAILSITIVFVILYASHRIAGPMYRFHQALGELGNRNLKALTRIREDDQLAEISTALESVRDRWAGDIAQLRRLAAELRERIPAGEAGEAARRNLGEMQSLLDSYTS
jgi:methyl-accepting chemotaxis protein